MAPSQPACEVIPSVARIDEEKCTRCGLCLRPAHCVAISIEDGRVVIDEAECLGCGTCFLLCPTDAISMVEIQYGNELNSPEKVTGLDRR